MEAWLLILLSLFISTSILLLLTKKKNSRLPPGPVAVPILGNLLWLRHSVSNIKPILRNLHRKYGPIVTLHIGSRLTVFISDRHLAHKALIEHGAVFSDRPAQQPSTQVISGNQHAISSATYGPLWRLLRRNLTSEILHSSRVKLYADGRDWVLNVLITHLYTQSQSSGDGSVVSNDGFQFAMFCLLVLMCFGEKLDEKAIREIQDAQRDLLLYGAKLRVFLFFPSVTKRIYRDRWRTAMDMSRRQMEIYLPLIKARREHMKEKQETEERFVYSYLDSLLDIKLPEEGGRRLTDDEMVGLCSEFLNAGTDTTSTALQWIMAELVKNQEIQRKLFEEMESFVKDDLVKEEELHKMKYLKAVVMEGLRRHPPAHFVLAHSVTEDVEIGGYVIPKKSAVNFLAVDMGWDEKVWEEPMEFKPERFLEGEVVDVTGSREIKMMPFGVGRRICPAHGLAMFHLEYFVANLVNKFEWKVAEGHEVDLSEKPEFTIVMKFPFRARLIPRKQW